MKHLICGCGVVGVSTGVFLEANGFDVTYYDINRILLVRLKGEGKKIVGNVKGIKSNFDVVWVCVPETKIENLFVLIPKRLLWEKIIIIRSSTIPGIVQKLQKDFKIPFLYHIPEFLREKSAIDDTFNPDRVVIGKTQEDWNWVTPFFKSLTVPKILTTATESELIKLISNAWLSTQVSFWNEIKKLLDSFKVNPQLIANSVTLDKRISKYGTILFETYGSNLLGKKFAGKCLPKDLDNFIDCFEEKKVECHVLKAVKKVNEEL